MVWLGWSVKLARKCSAITWALFFCDGLHRGTGIMHTANRPEQSHKTGEICKCSMSFVNEEAETDPE